MTEPLDGKRFVDISGQFINELDTLSDAIKSTTVISEKEFKERKFPIKFNYETHNWEWNEDEVRKFYEDPENVSRTIYCKKLNVDETDDWGMSGFTPGFIFLEKINYKGSKTLADHASSVGLSIGTDPKTGLGIMNHFDYFPKNKFDYRMIRKDGERRLFEVMCDIFTKRKIESSPRDNTRLLSNGS
jgi:hypothetical protein